MASIMILLVVASFLYGAWIQDKVTLSKDLHQQIKLSNYACHDGCSIATKNLTGTGYLNNFTWDCWDKCDRYMEELCNEIKG